MGKENEKIQEVGKMRKKYWEVGYKDIWGLGKSIKKNQFKKRENIVNFLTSIYIQKKTNKKKNRTNKLEKKLCIGLSKFFNICPYKNGNRV